MTHIREDPVRHYPSALGCVGAGLGVAVTMAPFVLDRQDSYMLLNAVAICAVVLSLVLVRRPRWRPLGIGFLVGSAGMYVAGCALFLFWLAGLTPS